MQQLQIGNVIVDSIIERDGPWRRPADLFPAFDPQTARFSDRSVQFRSKA